MNKPKFILSYCAVFVFIFFFEWLFHGVMLNDIYMSTASLWRTPEAMHSRFLWMLLGDALLAIFFCAIFLQGYKNKGIMEGVRYGLLIGLLFAPMHIMMYVVLPISPLLMVYWLMGSFVEFIIAGIITAAIYRPLN
ncbi:MAG: hypothetical protein JKY13_02730 [Gammaproteobacteria bacterium]|nr:hypothetical protein [Gammaproteobacteria bacterium]